MHENKIEIKNYLLDKLRILNNCGGRRNESIAVVKNSFKSLRAIQTMDRES